MAATQGLAAELTAGGSLEADELPLHRAVEVAFALRRWADSQAPGRPTIGIARAGDGARDRARLLAEQGAPGAIVAEPGVAADAALAWISAREAELDSGPAHILSWKRPSVVREGGELDGPIANTVDRPWPMLGREQPMGELARRWAETASGRGSVCLIEGEPGAGKTRLVAEAAREAHLAGGSVHFVSAEETADERAPVVAAAAEEGATLVVLGDVDRRPQGGLDILESLAEATHANGLLVLATYSAPQLDADGVDAVARLRSVPGTGHIELSPLDAEALATVIAALSPETEPTHIQDAAAELADATSGNATYACELLRAGWLEREDRSSALPRSLRPLVTARAGRLGADAYDHLCAAAVAGREFDLPVLAEALGAGELELVRSLTAGERAGLIRVDGTRACFIHPVVAEGLREEVPLTRRAELHSLLGDALERRMPNTAEGAERLVHHRERASAARAERSDAGRCQHLIQLGRAQRMANDSRFRETLLEAARLAERLGEDELLREAALDNHRGFVSLVGGFDRERVAMLELAAERTPQGTPEHARVLAQLALELTFLDRARERRRDLADTALGIAREADDRAVLAATLTRAVVARWGPDNAEWRAETARESIALSAALDDPFEMFFSLQWRATAQIELGEIGPALEALAEQRQIADRLGNHTGHWLCECMTSLHSALRGDLAEAEATAQRALDLAQAGEQPDAAPFYVSQLAAIRWQQGRLAELAPLLTEAADRHPGLPAFRSLATLANAVAGQHLAAREMLMVDTANDFRGLPVDPIWTAAVVTYGHAIAELGDREAAAKLVPLLEPHRGLLASTTISTWGLFEHALGRLELLLGREAAGRRSLLAAIDRYGAIRAPVWRAQAAADLAVAADDDWEGEPEVDRLRLLADARRAARGHDAGLVLQTLSLEPGGEPDLELSLRIEQLDLTRRQEQVLRLVVDGKSNREIADELQLSPSTVKRHLENIYDRTGARGRTALAASLLGR